MPKIVDVSIATSSNTRKCDYKECNSIISNRTLLIQLEDFNTLALHPMCANKFIAEILNTVGIHT